MIFFTIFVSLYRNFKILNPNDLYCILLTMSDEEDPLALINAIQNHRSLDEIRELIISGIDVNALDVWGRTALMLRRTGGWRARRGDDARAYGTSRYCRQ